MLSHLYCLFAEGSLGGEAVFMAVSSILHFAGVTVEESQHVYFLNSLIPVTDPRGLVICRSHSADEGRVGVDQMELAFLIQTTIPFSTVEGVLLLRTYFESAPHNSSSSVRADGDRWRPLCYILPSCCPSS